MSPAPSPPSDPLYLLGAGKHQFEDGVDRRAHVRVRDHRDAMPARAPHDLLLNPPDVVEMVDVFLVRTETVERGVANHEVRAVLLLVLDGQHALDDKRAVDTRQ